MSLRCRPDWHLPTDSITGFTAARHATSHGPPILLPTASQGQARAIVPRDGSTWDYLPQFLNLLVSGAAGQETR
jgi:hypothetical protein